MKIKKIIVILLSLIIMGLLAGIFNVSYAATGSMYLNIKNLRESGYGYKVLDKSIIKIYQTNDTGTTANYNNTIYCLKGGIGFGSNEIEDTTAKYREYTKYFDMKDPSAIESPYIDALPSPTSTTYKSLLWLLENVYVAPKTNASSEEIANTAAYKEQLLTAAGITTRYMTDDDIDVVQQLAVWHFTNDDEYKIEQGDTFEFWVNAIANSDSNYNALSDEIGEGAVNGWERVEECQMLFDYLVGTATEKGSTYVIDATNIEPLILEETSPEAVKEGSNYVIGPFKIKQNREQDYTLEATLTSNAGTITPTKIQDVNGNVFNDYVATIGKEFYLVVPKTTDIEGLNFSITEEYYNTTITYWSVLGADTNEQPVALVNRTSATYNKQLSVTTPEKEFDLALRKFITSINDVAPTTSREPQISAETLNSLANGSITTLEKVHPKNALTVKTGDKVVYTIRVYNEGELDGYAKEITDYLPEGLTLASNSIINTNNGWTNPSGDGVTIVTNKLAGTLLSAFDGTTIDFADVQVECEVTATALNSERSLQNIAEITIDSDANGNTSIVDRDSLVNNVDLEKYALASQEDDDDFELLTMQKATGSYELELEKVDGDDSSQKLQGAEFEITLPDGTIKRLVTSAEGKISISDLSITEEGIQTITIKEAKASSGYSNSSVNIKVQVTTTLENGTYSITPSITTDNTSDVSTSVSGNKISLTVKNHKLDLALRKFITSINNVAPTTSREPQISTETLNSLANGNITTLEKVHPKSALTVKTGDKVVYTIRVYNEGKIDGYVKQITDYLPDGLKLVENSTINISNGWTNPSGDGKTIVTDTLSGTLISAFNGTNVQYLDVQVECEVTAVAGAGVQEFKNIAEITLHSDANGDMTVVDRDSSPNNVNKLNYGTASQEDDDDFELLTMEKATGSYALELIKVDGNNTETKLEGAEFEVTLPDGTNQTLTTDADGKINIATIAINEAGEQTITLKEIKAPTGYSKNNNTIEIKANTKLENGKYVLDTASLTAQIAGVSCTAQDNKITVQMENYQLDFALRKFIAKINDVAPTTSREPQISTTTLTEVANGSTTTAEKVHAKDSLIVKTGDKVVYTIRVYNEGKIDGYVKQITDYLPDGLKLIENSTINTASGWTNPSGDGKTIVTDKLAGTLLSAFDGTTLQYLDVQVECEVTAVAGANDQELKNIAEITLHSDANNDETVVDRDSTPNNVDKDNYGLTSQQDDDDFEVLVLEKAKGNYELEIVKLDKDNHDLKLEGAEFEITLANGTKQTLTTDAEGKINITNIAITEEGTQTINIKETEAPDGYNKNLSNINIDIVTKIDNGIYVVESAGVSNVEGVTCSASENKISVEVENEIIDLHLNVDLALRKFITSINNVAPTTSREPQISTETLNDLANSETTKVTTAEKLHTKDALTVKTGDKVVYTIRVYNEGKDHAYVKQITDYLPDGLKLADNSTINTENGWANPSGDGKTIVTAKLAGTLLPGFDGTTLQYLDVQVECEVTALPGASSKELKNIAEITLFSNEDGNEAVTDRDSTPNNVNKDSYGTTSQQDDDDFELLIIEKAEGTYELEIIKSDGENKDTKLEGAIFEVTLADGRKQTLTTNAEGKINIAGLPIAEEGEQTITIKETKAPTGYSRIADTMQVKVSTKIEDGKFVVDTATLVSQIDGVVCSEQDNKITLEMDNYKLDLALRKFITQINGVAPAVSREPQITLDTLNSLASGDITTADKVHPKDRLMIKTGDKIIYTIRVYNEGKIDGYVKQITDYLPDGLKLVADSEINTMGGWTNPSGDGKTIVTDSLAGTLLPAFDGTTLQYLEVAIECEVTATANDGISTLKNIAEITLQSDKNGDETVADRDSTPNNVDKDNYGLTSQEDDDDFEEVILQKFDLSLRKFITAVDELEVTNRVPVFSIDQDGNYTYTHIKTPLEVESGDVIVYTLRVYNEGNLAGYVEELKDDLPEGLVYLPENSINQEYRWKLYKEDGTETTDVAEAVTIKTDYLSKAQETETGKDNLIAAFDRNTMSQPAHKDVKIAFQVTEPNTSDRILINMAEISNDSNEEGDPVDDIDSTPDNNQEGEDDIDTEAVKVKYFDLALEKIISEYSVQLNSSMKNVVTKTNHRFGVQPEPVVKIELRKDRIDTATIKYKYQIKVTNEGEIAGYATEVKDYIPEGLRFTQEDNPNWILSDDGKTATTDQLKDTLLQPGDSAIVEIVLQWKNGQDNLGLKQNLAEISEDANDKGEPVEDIDSTPDNSQEGEDDIDDAEVILSITTGEGKSYIIIVGGVLALLSTGIVLIKKYVI